MQNDLTSLIFKFIKKYYIDSIIYKQGYNPVNTATWILLLFVILYFLYKLLKNKIRIDEKLVICTIPYIIFGSCLRIVEDSGLIEPPFSYLLMSPMIFFLIFAIAFPVLFISLKLAGDKYWKIYAFPPVFLIVLVLSFLVLNLKIRNWFVLPASITFALISLTIYIILVKHPMFSDMSDKLSKFCFFSGMLDGWGTFIALSYFNYSEIHVIPKILVSIFGPAIIPIIKALVFFLAIYAVNKSETDQSNFLKLVLITFGLGPGLRNCLRVTFGV